jgi:hypothetical protein
MHLILHLTPETEAKLKERASLTGKNPEVLAIEAIEDRLVNGDESVATLSYDAWKAKFDELLATMPRGNPNADLSRESEYEARGE